VLALVRAAIDAPLTSGTLVLRSPKPLRGKGALPEEALIASGALVVDCRSPYDAPGPWDRSAAPHEHELARWVVARLRAAHGKRIALVDAHALTRTVGSDVGMLDGALRSVALYVGEKDAVTAADLHEATGGRREEPAWRLVDAVLDRDLPRALDLCAQAFEHGLADPRGGVLSRPEAVFPLLVGALHASWRKTLAGAEALARGEAQEATARSLAIAPFQTDAFLQRCRRDPEAMLRSHGAFLEAERGVRGGGVPPRLAFERLILALIGSESAKQGVPRRR
jgi:hypothetical protein